MGERPFDGYDALFTGSRLFLIGLSRTGGIERVGKSALEPYGFAANEVLGLAFVDGPWWRELPATRTLVDAGLARAFEGESFHETLVLATASGERRDLQLSIDPVGEDAVDFLLAMGTDVTEARRRERAGKSERVRVDEAFAAADITSWQLAVADGPFATDLVPADITDSEPDGCRERVHADDIERVECAWQRTAETGEPFELALRVRIGDGYRWLISHGETERDAAGIVTRLSGVTVDVTRQHAATQALAVNEMRYRQLFDSTQEGFIVLEPTRDAHGRITDVRYVEANPAFERHTGLSNVVGRLMRGEVVPDLEEVWIDRLRQVAESGEPVEFVDRAEALDRWFEVGLTRIESTSGIRLGCLFRDVTERELADVRLKRLAVDLAAQDARKNAFLATLAHELRNPLGAVRQALHLFEDEPTGLAEREQLHAMMERQIGHMSRLVDDLLDVSRISNDKLVLVESTVRADELVANAIETVRPLLAEHGHTLSTRLPDAPLALRGDPVRLTQVLSNLLTNAAHYTPDGGAIEVSVVSDPNGLRFSVADNGIGLDTASQERIFELFSQVCTDSPGRHGGLGLGLTLALTLVEMHGGKLRVASAGLGKGSVFTMSLPLARRASDMSERSAAPGRASSNVQAATALSVLVVDDNHDAALTLAKILGRYGYRVDVAHDGAGALALARTARPDVLVLDIGLPDISGHDVAATLRAERPDATLIALTGWGTKSDIARSTAAGFDHHMTKPIRAAALLEVLREVGIGRTRDAPGS